MRRHCAYAMTDATSPVTSADMAAPKDPLVKKKTVMRVERPQATVNVGDKIREKRQSLRLTLQNLADSTDLSISFLSQIERGVTIPSLSSLTCVAEALGERPSYFLDQPPGRLAISKRGARQPYSVGPGTVTYERLSSEFDGSTLSSLKMNIPAGYKSETISHEGEEFVFVVCGKIRYVVDNAVYDLSVGDALHFDARRPHSIQNPTTEPAEVLSTVTLAVF